MASSFPTSLDTLSNPTSTDTLSGHAEQHSSINDAVEALEAKVGVNSSAVSSSLDYKVTNTSSSDPGHKHTLANGATDVTASVTELNYVDGVTSSIQTQLDTLSNRIKIIYKTADEIVNNSTTLQDDNHLIFPVLANEIWSLSIQVNYEGNSTADIKFGWSYPSGTTIKYAFDDAPQAHSTESTAFTCASSGIGAPDIGKGNAIVVVGSTPGNVVLKWAQNSAHASDLTMYAKSNIIGFKLS